MPKTTDIFGSPGTGKTTALVNFFDQALKNRKIDDIGFVTYTKSASREFKQRVEETFGISQREMRWIGTLHSMCYKLLPERTVASELHREAFCEEHNIQFKPSNDGEYDFYIPQYFTSGEMLFACFDYARHTNPNNPLNALREAPQVADLDPIYRINLERYYNAWQKYKETQALRDYTDMLVEAYYEKLSPSIRILFADEAQDFTYLQHLLVRQFAENTERVYRAGDDDQKIFSYMGAESNLFLDTSFGERIILNKSHRLPSNLLNFSMKWISSVAHRVKKLVEPREDGGEIIKLYKPDLNEILQYCCGKTFLLFRTNYMISQIGESLTSEMVPHKVIKQGTLWTSNVLELCRIFRKIKSDEFLTADELNLLFRFFPVKGLLKHGTKTKIEKIAKGEEQTLTDKFKMNEHLVSVLDARTLISHLKKPIRQTQKKVITYYTFNADINIPTYEDINMHLGTIYAAKGLECDTAILFTDITKRIYYNIIQNKNAQDDEKRVFYVGMTRPRAKLVIVDGYFNTYKFDVGEC